MVVRTSKSIMAPWALYAGIVCSFKQELQLYAKPSETLFANFSICHSDNKASQSQHFLLCSRGLVRLISSLYCIFLYVFPSASCKNSGTNAIWLIAVLASLFSQVTFISALETAVSYTHLTLPTN